jgi:hypothetical protein
MRHSHAYFLILCTVLFSACQTPYPNLFIAPGDILFADDFSNTTSGWPRLNDHNGTMDYFGGAYRIVVMVPDYDLWTTSGHEYPDAHLEVDAGPLGGPLENRFGLVCRHRDAQNFYFFVISADGYYALGKVNNGIHSLLGQEAMTYSAAITTGFTFNHLRFDCTGNTLAAYINGQPIALAQDADFSTGDVGLLAGAFDAPGVDVAFDNFVVIKP